MELYKVQNYSIQPWILVSRKKNYIWFQFGSQAINSLQWCHTERDGVSKHWHLDGLLNRLFKPRSKKTSKLRVTGPCLGEFADYRWIPRTNGQ